MRRVARPAALDPPAFACGRRRNATPGKGAAALAHGAGAFVELVG
jgi:hypothetical protein